MSIDNVFTSLKTEAGKSKFHHFYKDNNFDSVSKSSVFKLNGKDVLNFSDTYTQDILRNLLLLTTP